MKKNHTYLFKNILHFAVRHNLDIQYNGEEEIIGNDFITLLLNGKPVYSFVLVDIKRVFLIYKCIYDNGTISNIK